MTQITSETIEQYHANGAASSSKISAFINRGPAYFHGRYVAKTIPQDQPTEALINGNAFDCLVTEGHKAYGQRYLVKPKGMSFSTTTGKAWKALWGVDADDFGRTIIPYETHEMFLAMRSALLDHPIASQFLEAPERVAQATFRIDSEKYEQAIQMRPDIASPRPIPGLTDDLAWSLNIKTTADMADWVDTDDLESPRSCTPIRTYGYDRQAALDQYVLFQHQDFGKTAHMLAVVEKQCPYRCVVVRMSDAYLDLGFHVTDINLRRIANCYRTGAWPKMGHLIITANPAQWQEDRANRIQTAVSGIA